MQNTSTRRLLAICAALGLLGTVAIHQPAVAAPGQDSICFQQTFDDAAGDAAALDVVSLEVTSDCRRWYFDFTTSDAWGKAALGQVTIDVDLDRDPKTGCDGSDASAVGIWRADVATLAAATIVTPSCDEATWYNNGQGSIERNNTRHIRLSIGKNTFLNDEHFNFVATAQRAGRDQIDQIGSGTGFAATNTLAPAAPGRPTVVDGTLNVATWTLGASGPGTIRDYDVDYRSNGGEWQRLFRIPTTATGTTERRAEIHGVSGEKVDVRVRAITEYGVGEWSPTGSNGRTGVTCAGIAATWVGTEGDDVYVGTPGRDVIAGLGGNDRLYGVLGDDVICGGDGNDSIYLGPGDDVAYGGNDKDVIIGARGDDQLFGQKGNDRMKGGPGDDLLVGGPGTNRLNGVGGIDECRKGNVIRNCEA